MKAHLSYGRFICECFSFFSLIAHLIIVDRRPGQQELVTVQRFSKQNKSAHCWNCLLTLHCKEGEIWVSTQEVAEGASRAAVAKRPRIIGVLPHNYQWNKTVLISVFGRWFVLWNDAFLTTHFFYWSTKMKILTGFFLKHQTSWGCFAYPKLRPRAATKITSTEMTNILNPVLDTKQSSNLRHIFQTFGKIRWDHNWLNSLLLQEPRPQGLYWARSGPTFCF